MRTMKLRYKILAAIFAIASRASALSCVMQAVSAGTDGPFNIVVLDGNNIYQSADTGGGVYAGFMYFRRPAGINFSAGATLYMEVDFKDTGGPGSIGAQYNSVS